MGVIVGRDIEDVAGRGLRNHQCVAGGARHDVEKRQHMVVLIDLVTGKLAAQDFREDVIGVVGGHGWLLMSNPGRELGLQAAGSAALRNGPASVSSRAASATYARSRARYWSMARRRSGSAMKCAE